MTTGRPIDYLWCDGRPDWWAVRGHGHHETARAFAIDDLIEKGQLDDDEEVQWDEDGEELLVVSAPDLIVRDAWARWEFSRDMELSWWDGNGSRPRHLELYHRPGPGRFPITVALDAKVVERARRRRRRHRKERRAAVAWVRRCYPEATQVRVCVQAWPHPTRVEMRLPGLLGPATMEPSNGVGHVQLRDLDAWNDLYGMIA